MADQSYSYFSQGSHSQEEDYAWLHKRYSIPLLPSQATLDQEASGKGLPPNSIKWEVTIPPFATLVADAEKLPYNSGYRIEGPAVSHRIVSLKFQREGTYEVLCEKILTGPEDNRRYLLESITYMVKVEDVVKKAKEKHNKHQTEPLPLFADEKSSPDYYDDNSEDELPEGFLASIYTNFMRMYFPSCVD